MTCFTVHLPGAYAKSARFNGVRRSSATVVSISDSRKVTRSPSGTSVMYLP
jgi:hypothetical protein